MSENVVYDKSTKYNILDNIFYVYSEQLDNCINTVVDFNDELHYLGDKPNNIETIIELYEKIFDTKLSGFEALEVIIENNFLKD